MAAILPAVAACDSSTEPTVQTPSVSEINTVAIKTSGALELELEAVMPSRSAALQFVDGEGTGVHIAAWPGQNASRLSGADLPVSPPTYFAVHLPGIPDVGEVSLGPWDPLRDGGMRAPRFVVGNPSVSFGDSPAAMLDFYASLEGGRIEIESITLPEYGRDGSPGSVRGRLNTRAVSDTLLLLPHGIIPFEPDTVDVSAEFWVELAAWRTGRAAVDFTDGALASVSASQLIGSGSIFTVGGDPGSLADAGLLISFVDALTPSGDRIEIWFGELERTTAEFTFRVPVGNVREFGSS